MVNNEPIPNINGDTSIHPVNHYHQFQTLTYDLSDYAGTTFSLKLQTSCKYYNDLAISRDFASQPGNPGIRPRFG